MAENPINITSPSGSRTVTEVLTVNEQTEVVDSGTSVQVLSSFMNINLI